MIGRDLVSDTSLENMCSVTLPIVQLSVETHDRPGISVACGIRGQAVGGCFYHCPCGDGVCSAINLSVSRPNIQICHVIII